MQRLVPEETPWPPSSPPEQSVTALAGERVDHRFKALPPDAEGLTVGALAAERRNLFTGGFTTPVLALSAECRRGQPRPPGDVRGAARPGLRAARQDVDVPSALRPPAGVRRVGHHRWPSPTRPGCHRAFGIGRIFLANELVDAVALRWLAGELDADPGFTFACYVDSVRGVELMDEALRAAGAVRPVDVVIELGAGDGARTGARTEADCAAVADAVAATSTLRLVGVAGYEGEVPDASPERVREWLRRLVALAADLDAAGRFSALADGEEILVSAGGSAWFDAVADVFAEVPALSRPVLKLLRSGAYVSHDDGHYRHLTPFNRIPEEGTLQPAFRLWAQVVSRPTAGAGLRQRGQARRGVRPGPPRGAGRPLRARRLGPAGHRHHRQRASPTSTGGCVRRRGRSWRSATGSAWGSRTPARRSTSGS